MIRTKILEIVLRDKIPPSIEKIAFELTLDELEVLRRLAVEPLLDDTPEEMELDQALVVERAYAPAGIFTPGLVELLTHFEQSRVRFAALKERIKAIEKTKELKSKDEPP